MNYPIRCGCGFAGDVFAKVKDLDEEGRLPCPNCGTMAHQDYSRKTVFNGNRAFSGQKQESLTEGWSPLEVDRVQREMAADGFTDAANCIDKDGTVRFKDRATQQKYMAAKAAIWKRVADGPGQTMEDAQLVVKARKERERAAKKAAYEKKHGPLARRERKPRR